MSGVITLYDSLGVPPIEHIDWWKKIRLAFKAVIPTYLDECGVLKAKCISIETYKVKFEVANNVPIQGNAYKDCGVCIFLHRLCQNLSVNTDHDPTLVGLAYREHMVDYLWKYRIREPRFKKPDNQLNVLPQWQRLTFANMLIPPPPPEPNIKIPQGNFHRSYKGTNLIAVGMDGNNQILPIAMGVTQAKTGASWTWFLSRFVRKLLVTRLVEYLKGLLQRCRKSKGQNAKEPKLEGQRNLFVESIPSFLQQSGTSVCGLINCNLWAQPWFMNTTLKDTYRELVYPLKDVSMWEAPNDLQQVLPPRMVKQPAGRPKNTNRILSRGKAPSLDGCTRCGIRGHNQNSCTQLLPSQQGTHRQKRMSNKTHMTQEHLTREALLDEERARNGRIYQDCYDLEAQEQEDSTNNTYDPSQPSTSQGYMFHQLKGELSTPYESYHLDDL
ncbi:transposase, MuDR, MULE transposase domain protein [Tanacetum coccineum]